MRRPWRRRGQETVIVVPFLEMTPAIESLRANLDRSAASGVPAHVTVLYPFVPLRRLDDRVFAEVASVARSQPAFDVTFSRVGRFPNVVYLAPEPADLFVAMTMDCVRRFPEQQPYGGAFDEVIPHMTVSDTIEPPGLEEELNQLLPIQARASELWLMTQIRSGGWAMQNRFPLG